MSESLGYTPGEGAEIAVDIIDGKARQRVKVQFGDDGSATDVSATNPMPITAPDGIAVTGALTNAELRAAAVPVSGPLTDAQLRATAIPIEAQGELVSAIEALRFAVASLTKSIGFALPNALGQPIFEARQATAGNLQVTATQAGTWTVNANQSGTWTVNANQSGTWNIGTLTTMTNQAQIGGFAANDQIPALMHLQADNLRRNITVT
jgi:hypothetical protein